MTAPLSMLSVFPAGVLGSPLALRRTRENPFPTVLWPVLWENRDRIGEPSPAPGWIPMPSPINPFSQAQALNAPRVPIAFREMRGDTAEPAVEVTFLPEGAPSGDAIRVRGRATFPCESELEARVVEFEDSLSRRGRGLRIYLLPAGLLRGSAKCDSPFLFEGTFPVAWLGSPKATRVQVIAAGRFGPSGFDEEMLHDRYGPGGSDVLPSGGGTVGREGFATGNEGCPICGTYAWDTRFMRPLRASDGSTHHPSCPRVRAPSASPRPGDVAVAESKETWDYADPYGRVGDAFMNRPRPRARVSGGCTARGGCTAGCGCKAAGCMPGGATLAGYMLGKLAEFRAAAPAASTGTQRPRVAGTPLFFTQVPAWATPILQEISHRDYPTACIDQLGDVSTSLALARAVYDSRSAAHLDQLAETLLAHLSTQRSIFDTTNGYLVACAYNELKMQAARLRMQGLY